MKPKVIAVLRGGIGDGKRIPMTSERIAIPFLQRTGGIGRVVYIRVTSITNGVAIFEPEGKKVH